MFGGARARGRVGIHSIVRVFVSLCETKTRVFGFAEHGKLVSIREADAGNPAAGIDDGTLYYQLGTLGE